MVRGGRCTGLRLEVLPAGVVVEVPEQTDSVAEQMQMQRSEDTASVREVAGRKESTGSENEGIAREK
jgi:hypothetical protein